MKIAHWFLLSACVMGTVNFEGIARARPDWIRMDDEKTGTIEGRVRTEDKQPADRVTVRLLKRDIKTEDLHEVDSLTTDKDGYFKFKEVHDGTYIVESFKGDLKNQRHLTLDKGEKVENLEITLHKEKKPKQEQKF